MSALANPSAPKPAAEAAAAASVGCACTHSRTIGGVADFCRRVLPITDKTVFFVVRARPRFDRAIGALGN